LNVQQEKNLNFSGFCERMQVVPGLPFERFLGTEQA